MDSEILYLRHQIKELEKQQKMLAMASALTLGAVLDSDEVTDPELCSKIAVTLAAIKEAWAIRPVEVK